MKEPMNCLLCFCPRFDMGIECGGDFVILDNGVKDCSNCNRPHDPIFVEEYLKAKLKGDQMEQNEFNEENIPPPRLADELYREFKARYVHKDDNHG